MKIKGMVRSRREKKIIEEVKKKSNLGEVPVCEQAEILMNHPLHIKEKKYRTFAQGPLYRETKHNAGWVEQARREGNIPAKCKSNEISMYRVGPVRFLVPDFMGNSFLTRCKYNETFLGKRILGMIFAFLLILSYAFLIYYLPQSNTINEGELLSSRIAVAIYVASILTAFFAKLYDKRTTAWRVNMICLDPTTCDRNQIHVALFVTPEHPIKEQIEWWYGTDIPNAMKHLNQGLAVKQSMYERELVEARAETQAAIDGAQIKAHEHFSTLGYLPVDDKKIIWPRYAIFTMTLIIIVLTMKLMEVMK